jgi:predicted CXXCH cytochrome family protein
MRNLLFAWVLILATAGSAESQVVAGPGDVLGAHDLSPSGASPVKGTSGSSCLYCHAPHSGVGSPGNTPLWAQTLSTQTYSQLYSSTTMQNLTQQPMLGGSSNLCLSCHDGTVALGQTVPYGQLQMSSKTLPIAADLFGPNLQGSHPFSFKLPANGSLTDSPDLVASLATGHTTADPLKQVKLVNNNVECTSCHEPHVQAIDPVSKNFLVRDSSAGQLCLSCHEPGMRTLGNLTNPIAQWSSSIHALAVNKVSLGVSLGSYGSIAQNACLSCHMPHNATAGAQLLVGPNPPTPNMDTAAQNCITCHNGGSNVSPPIPNVYAELAKSGIGSGTGHPLPSGSNTHDAGEAARLDNNRHTTCVDCHNPHSSLQVAAFASPLPPMMRASQGRVVGISASDGTTVLNPAVNQYENCLRCHGTSAGKQMLTTLGYSPVWVAAAGDSLNVIAQFSVSATSSHPVMHDRSSALPQPSLLPSIWNLDGKNQGRAMGTRILCTDCHNSDDNREFGGAGPNGPHGSQYTHILERRYEFSQVVPGVPPAAGPGTTIQNLFPNPVLSPDCGSYPCPSPFALCAKCHDLNNVILDASFRPGPTGKGGHSLHINTGFSCSVCHTAHGNGATSPAVSGERLVNFDINVVAPNAAVISYNRSTNTCILTCHNYAHNADGTVSAAQAKGAAPLIRQR